MSEVVHPIRQYDHGAGDHTAERAELLEDLASLEDVKRELDQLRTKKRAGISDIVPPR